MQRRRIILNAAMSVVQTIVVGAILFVLYRYLLKSLGAEAIGIWSLVLATTSVTRIADLGLSASVVKFVAKYVARGEDGEVSGVIQTAIVSAGFLIALILLLVFPLASWLLRLVIPPKSLPLAISILPYALGSLWITIITSVFQSGLDGYQRTDLRSMLLIAGSLFYLTLSLLLVPAHGLMGLAYAQLIQASTLLFASWALLKRYLPVLPVIPWHWSPSLFKEMIGYGFNFQIVSVANMLYEPAVKGLLTNFGGLAAVGYYEMANRMVVQLRSLIVSANQVLVPAIANLHESKPQFVTDIYKESYRVSTFLSLPVFSLVFAFAPIISELWIGHYQSQFVTFAMLLAAGCFLNTLAAPAYFVNMGIGDLRWNTVAHITIGVLNLAAGFVLGKFFGGTGVVVGWVSSLAVGSLMITVAYHLKHRISFKELLPDQSARAFIATGMGILAPLVIYFHFRPTWNIFRVGALAIPVFSLIVGLPLWLHPMRTRLSGWIRDSFFASVVLTPTGVDERPS